MTGPDFIQFVKKECRYYGIKPKLRNVKYLVEGGRCTGYFDADNKVLACAMNNGVWISVLAHEYCHMRQWAEKAEPWMAANENDSTGKWWEWIKGVDIADIENHINVVRDMELDNEKRTVALIKALDLPVDVREYTKKCNSYIMFYNYMKQSRKWLNPAKQPLENQRLLAAMPDKFSLNYSVLPKRLELIYREENI